MKKKIFAVFLIFFFLSLLSLFFLKGEVLAGYCGLYGCEDDEDCTNCEQDCGECPLPPPPGTDGDWEWCGEHRCPNLVDWVEYECYPNCDEPQYCRDIGSGCPDDVPPGVECLNDADCFPNNCFCYGDILCEMHCINNACLSVCGPSDGNGGPGPGEPSGTITCVPETVPVCDPDTGTTNVTWSTQNTDYAEVWRQRDDQANQVLWRTGLLGSNNFNSIVQDHTWTFRLYTYDNIDGMVLLDHCSALGLCVDCTVVCPPTMNIPPGDTRPFTVQITDLDGTIRRVNFAIVEGDTSVITINPTYDETEPYSTNVTAVAASDDPRTVRARVRVNPGNVMACACTTTVNVNFPTWFQTQEADVHAQANISSEVPSGQVFCLDGDGNRPGVVSYGGGSPYFGEENNISSTDWLVNTSFSRKPYGYFEDLINRHVTPTELSCDVCSVADMEVLGSGFYKRTGGALRIINTDDGVVNFVDKKIVILVDGSLTLEANVDIADDSGFVAFIVRQDINIGGFSLTQGGDDPDLEGVFLANNNFDLGSSNNRFIGKGIFFADSFNMSGRDLGVGNEGTPAIQFIYNPSLWFNAPKELLVPSYTWEELTPESE